MGMVADNPAQKIELKAFCAEVINDHKALTAEHDSYKDLPQFSNVSPNYVAKSFQKVKDYVRGIVRAEIERIMDTPGLMEMIIKKG